MEIQQQKPATKLVEVHLSALTRVEYMEVVEVPENITQDELNELVNDRYQKVDGGEYVSDSEYWERGTCYAVNSDIPGETPSMMAFRTEHGLHVERADAEACIAGQRKQGHEGEMATNQENNPDPDGFLAVIIGNEYEFYAEMQQAELPEQDRMRNYTSQKVKVIAGPLPKDPETSDLFVVRAADGREFEAYIEELNGWDKALGQYFWPDGAYGPERDLRYLCNEERSDSTERASA